ncbi:tripartite tricarboxylate transporter TctB family protein [Rhodobacter sp. NTK016B]|uniref:tripartite tricarboxylate transporter TctB family protein n=1 Tax=Rhodobacter sp. NTK016B TaxID=2759676 RepID=UPI001A8ED027|nr:tripartite tricarboxylate transporter TctB family protein [Rhodobacter sp. NTK016B]MBN8291785.1 tripartite tricarboxylate transporter TctB family protein [Rhodobacter sp. NTK016B]
MAAEPRTGRPQPRGLWRILTAREGLGAVFLLICALIVGIEASGLSMGRGRMVGPGYFPAILCALFVLFAVILLVQAIAPGRVTVAFGPLRPAAMMIAAIAAFCLTFPFLGAGGAIIILVVIAALAESGRRPLELLILSVVLVALVWLVFRIGLNLQLPMYPGDV